METTDKQQRNRDKALAWYHAHREEALVKRREYYAANKQKWTNYREQNRERVREANRRCRAKDPEKWRRYNRQYSKKLVRRRKQEAIENYGGRCECCGESRWEFLTVDHIYNDGSEDRKIGRIGKGFYAWLRRQGYPRDRFRLLCMNCNTAFGFYGYCPHRGCSS